MLKIIFFLWISLTTFSVEAQSYVVIVNSQNSFKGNPKAFYTLEKEAWPSGEEVEPVGIKIAGSLENGVILSGFVKRVLKLGGISEYREYWIRQKSKGKTKRPVEKKSFKAVLKLVSREIGGIGYVPKAMAEANSKVRILSEFNP